jgi:hypothetical protein
LKAVPQNGALCDLHDDGGIALSKLGADVRYINIVSTSRRYEAIAFPAELIPNDDQWHRSIVE